MKKFKGSEVVIYAVALMLVAAGYFNYMTFENQTQETYSEDVKEIKEETANVGDAVLVSNNDVQNMTNNAVKIKPKKPKVMIQAKIMPKKTKVMIQTKIIIKKKMKIKIKIINKKYLMKRKKYRQLENPVNNLRKTFKIVKIDVIPQ